MTGNQIFLLVNLFMLATSLVKAGERIQVRNNGLAKKGGFLHNLREYFVRVNKKTPSNNFIISKSGVFLNFNRFRKVNTNKKSDVESKKGNSYISAMLPESCELFPKQNCKEICFANHCTTLCYTTYSSVCHRIV